MVAKMRRAVIALLLASPAHAQTYEPQPVPSVIDGSPQTTIPLNLGDDGTAQLDLGFDFPYWGQTFSSAWVSSNGTISFGTSSHLCCNGEPLEYAPRNTIYGFWTDLVNYSGNPYYRRTDGSFLVGWYGTNEYGSGNQETLEVNLFSSGDIQLNYGSLGLQYHTATAGLTGPEYGDNVQIFYGRDPSPLRNTSWLFGVMQPATQIDCTVTPLDPSCPPQMIAPIDVVTSPAIVTMQDAYVEDTTADQAELAAATVPEPEQEILAAAVDEVTESITEQVAEAITAEAVASSTAVSVASVEPQAERLSPEQVAALAANGPAQDSQQVMQDAAVFASAGSTAQFGSSAAYGGGFLAQGSIVSVSGGNSVDVVASSGGGSNSPSSVANTLEVLNMSGGSFGASAAPSQGSDQQGSQGGGPDAEKMDAMASVPGFSAYAQVALQDRPDFYAVRDIYKNRRIRDANFEMYRMTQSNNAKWQEMVDVQYRQ